MLPFCTFDDGLWVPVLYVVPFFVIELFELGALGTVDLFEAPPLNPDEPLEFTAGPFELLLLPADGL